jgi:predicted XRE-type DNA-binding protein
MTTSIQPSSGNVFADLGFEAEEALNLRIRSDLMIAISKLIEDRGLTQTAAAKLFQVTQPRVSDLVRGKIDRFSVDSLLEMLGHAGADVSFVVTTDRQVA